jgi:NADH dehydrogenase (ubiquinone) 1 beta subcomplex subunit 3
MGFNWAKYEAWRRHPLLTTKLTSFQHTLPGLGTATIAFAAFVAYDKLIGEGSKQKSKGHH